MTSKNLQCIDYIDSGHLLMTSCNCSLTDKWLVTVTPSILTDVVHVMSSKVSGRQVWIWRLLFLKIISSDFAQLSV